MASSAVDVESASPTTPSHVLIATAGYEHKVRLWDVKEQTCISEIDFPDSQVNRLAISQNRKYLAVAGHAVAKIFEMKGDEISEKHTIDGHTGNIKDIGFEKNCNWIYTAGYDDKTIKIWDPRSGCKTAIKKLESTSHIHSVALHPNQGEFISANGNGTISIWDLTKAGKNAPKQTLVVEGAKEWPLSVCIASEASMLLVGTNKGNIHLFDPTNNYKLVKKFKAHTNYVLRCCISGNRKLFATASADNTAKVWDASDYTLKTTLTKHEKWVWDCAFSADSTFLLTGSSDKQVLLQSVKDGKLIRQYRGHNKAVTTIAMNDPR